MFTKAERLILVNQYRILKNFTNGKEERNHYDKMIIILQKGFSREYHNVYNDGYYNKIDDDILSDEHYSEVWEVLNMYNRLFSDYKRLSKEDKEEVDNNDGNLNFIGFDYNDGAEGKKNVYANFVLQNSYPELEHVKNSLDWDDEYNEYEISGQYGLTKYKYDKMVEKYEEIRKIRKTKDFSKDEIIEILNA